MVAPIPGMRGMRVMDDARALENSGGAHLVFGRPPGGIYVRLRTFLRSRGALVPRRPEAIPSFA